MISVGSNLLYETPDEDEEEIRDYSELFKSNLCNLRRIRWIDLIVAGGGIQHGSLIEIADCVNNQHASITVYHQNLDDIVDKYENGYIMLNPEVIPSIIRTKDEEEREEIETEEDSGSIDMEEDSDICEEVKQNFKRDHPIGDNNLDIEAKRQYCVC